MVVVDVKGTAEGWEDAKEMCAGGCQSLVAILRVKGRARRWLIVGRMERASAMAREPFCGRVVRWLMG